MGGGLHFTGCYFWVKIHVEISIANALNGLKIYKAEIGGTTEICCHACHCGGDLPVSPNYRQTSDQKLSLVDINRQLENKKPYEIHTKRIKMDHILGHKVGSVHKVQGICIIETLFL